jgi:uncharacterized pyridoxal phosphate-containing UPF0001 family protein
MLIEQEIRRRLNEVQARIADTLARVHRPPDTCRLVLASKTQSATALLAAYQSGARDFGENYVQEAIAKQEALGKLRPSLICHPEPAIRPDSVEGSNANISGARPRAKRAGESASCVKIRVEGPARIDPRIIHLRGASIAALSDVTWHLIGHLQTNKAAAALTAFSIIHSLNSERLATALHRLQPAPPVRTLLEINLGGESSKTGVAPDHAEALLAGIRDKVEVLGLMTIPPYSIDPSRSRPYFVHLRELRDRLAAVSGLALSELSMGMTDDYTIAIEEGATIVRVGRAVFGERT